MIIQPRFNVIFQTIQPYLPIRYRKYRQNEPQNETNYFDDTVVKRDRLIATHIYNQAKVAQGLRSFLENKVGFLFFER